MGQDRCLNPPLSILREGHRPRSVPQLNSVDPLGKVTGQEQCSSTCVISLDSCISCTPDALSGISVQCWMREPQIGTLVTKGSACSILGCTVCPFGVFAEYAPSHGHGPRVEKCCPSQVQNNRLRNIEGNENILLEVRKQEGQEAGKL